MRSLFGFNWRNSEAHLLLLTKFLAPKAINQLTGLEHWTQVLQEDATKAIQRFQKDGALRPATTSEKLEANYRVTDLQKLLKDRDLPSSGRKAELIQRLVGADPKGMERVVTGQEVLVCSDTGRAIAEEYRNKAQAERDNTERIVWGLLSAGKFKQASQAVAAFEARQVFPRGMGIDLSRHDSARDIAMIEMIFKKTPKILSRIPKEKLEPLRMAAATMTLWGTGSAKRWLPKDFTTNTSMDVDAAVRMFTFYASSQAAIKGYRESGVVKGVQVIAAQDSCPDCLKLNGKKFKLDSAIELPYEHCTHEMGCRCMWIAVLD